MQHMHQDQAEEVFSGVPRISHLKCTKAGAPSALAVSPLPRDAKDPDTLANLTVVGLHLGKNVSRYTA